MYGKFVEGLSKKGDKFGYLNKNKIRLGTTFAFSIGLYSFVSVLFFAEYFLPVIFIGLL